MTLTIHDLPPEVERRLRIESARLGVDETEYVKRLIERGLPTAAPTPPFMDKAALDLLAQWDAEDATNDLGEISKRQTDWESFRKSMNENSISGRPIYP